METKDQEDDVMKKQQLLLSEIIEKNYDQQEFQDFVQNQTGRSELDLADFTFDGLADLVSGFQGQKAVERRNELLFEDNDNRSDLTSQLTSELPSEKTLKTLGD